MLNGHLKVKLSGDAVSILMDGWCDKRVSASSWGSDGLALSTPEFRATLILLDGAMPAVFDELVSSGDLPNIGRIVLETGESVPATTSFPSTTGVAYLPFLTGCYPGSCNVPGIRWLDSERYQGDWWKGRQHVRSYCSHQGPLLNSDLPEAMPSLFDIEQSSVVLCSPFTRNLTQQRIRTSLARAALGSTAHFARTYKWLDRAVARDLATVARERFRFVFAVFPGVDGLAHSYDPKHPKVLNLYREFDSAIGSYARSGGVDGEHLLVIVSDHGMSRIDRHTDVSVELERRGLRVLRHPLIWRRNPQLAVMVSGNASAQVYLQPGVSRTHRWSIPAIEDGVVKGIPSDLVEWLANLEGIALVAGVDDEDVVVVSRAGRARLTDLGNGDIGYMPETADVLELGGSTIAKHERDWLADSISGRFPDSPMQLIQLFRSSRTGDLVVSASEHADLREDWELPEHRSGHGALTHDHMRCLVAANRELAGPMRSVDVFPAILNHLGHEIPAGIDGCYSGSSVVPQPI